MYAQRTEIVQQPAVQAVDEEVLLRERTLETSIAQIDSLIGGFRASRVSLLDSDDGYVSSLLHLLCVRAVEQFDEEVVWIDGGNEVNPYAMSALCRRLGLDKRDVLSRVNISRAFTAYQLVTLVEDKLEEQVARSAPSTVIISSISQMFLDKDMRWMESHQLLRRCLDTISNVTKGHETITLVTNSSYMHSRPSPGLTALLYEHADLALQVRSRRRGVAIRLPKLDREILFLPVPWNQATLDEFRRDDDGEDCPYISFGT